MRPGEKVRALRANGWDVQIRVERPLAGARDQTVMFARHELYGARWASKGGRTIVRVTDPAGRCGQGRANYNPEDVFAYAPGLRLALDRALGEVDQIAFNGVVESYMRTHDIAGPATRTAKTRAREVVAAWKRHRLEVASPASSPEATTP